MPDAIDPDADFYGTELIINEDGSTTIRHCGGFKPRLLTEAELRPWLILAQQSIERERRDDRQSDATAESAGDS